MTTKLFFWKDKSGRGDTATDIPLDNILLMENDTNWDGDELHEWTENAEQGDEWENASDKYICTKLIP